MDGARGVGYAQTMRLSSLLVLVPIALVIAACSSGGAVDSTSTTGGGGTAVSTGGAGAMGAGGSDAGTSDGGPIGGDRPVTVYVPSTYDPKTPAPLVITLHGYGASGVIEELYVNIKAEASKRGFLYAYPDGTLDASSQRFWNATDACCNFGGSKVDDSAYLSGVIADIQARFSVDPKRIYLFGHSNGGFMAYRMACEHADQIAAIASLAGAMFNDETQCAPSGPVSVLQIHGTADAVIAYNGGANAGNVYPSAQTSVEDWAALDGCSLTADTSSPPIDLEAVLPGAETTVRVYGAGCKTGGHAELWTVEGGAHIPALSSTFTSRVVDFLYAHPKP